MYFLDKPLHSYPRQVNTGPHAASTQSLVDYFVAEVPSVSFSLPKRAAQRSAVF
jgi:hypothetical protein